MSPSPHRSFKIPRNGVIIAPDTWSRDARVWSPCKVLLESLKLLCTKINFRSLWFGRYWNWLSDKIWFSSTNLDIIYYCIQNFAWTNQTITNLIHGCHTCVQFNHLRWYCKKFKQALLNIPVGWPSGLGHWISFRKAAPGVGSNPTAEIYFHFTFSLSFRSLQLGEARTKWNQVWHSSRVIGA